MTLRDWLKQLEQNPTDWELYGPFSDWLEERGKDKQAYAIRWMGTHKKIPRRKIRLWGWVASSLLIHPRHRLPKELLESHEFFQKGTFWNRVEALARGLVKLKKRIDELTKLYEV